MFQDDCLHFEGGEITIEKGSIIFITDAKKRKNKLYLNKKSAKKFYGDDFLTIDEIEITTNQYFFILDRYVENNFVKKHSQYSNGRNDVKIYQIDFLTPKQKLRKISLLF